MLIRMRELAVQSASSNINDMNRQGLQSEYTQIIQEIDRVAFSSTYNNQVLLTGFGNVVSADASTSLTNSNTTGVTAINISGAQHGEYTFEDGLDENTITLGNGTVTQTIRLGQMLDGDVVATGSTMVANFDRLGIQITLAGANVTNATGDYEHGELDDMTIVIDQGTGGSFQVGPDDGANQRIEVGMPDMRASGAILNLNASSISSMYSARAAISQVDQAIDYVSNQRGDLGAFMNRMQYTISWIENEIENMQNSEDSISSADIAEEITALTRSQILTQAATSMLTQSNAQTANALSLLQ
jgi:flagellin